MAGRHNNPGPPKSHSQNHVPSGIETARQPDVAVPPVTFHAPDSRKSRKATNQSPHYRKRSKSCRDYNTPRGRSIGFSPWVYY